MTDYDNRKENQAFAHVEKMQEIAEKRRKELAEKQRAESDHKPQQTIDVLFGVPRDPYFDHANEVNC